MKLISIIRHAKAEPFYHYDEDFDRPLTHRGEKDAIRMAKQLVKLGYPIDWWLSSPALRASQTTMLMTDRAGYDTPIQWEQLIYMAAAQTLLDLLCEVPDEAEHVVLVGHNPGMEMLVCGLCTGSPLRLLLNMSTGAMAHIKLNIQSWQQIRWNCGLLHLLLQPKALRK